MRTASFARLVGLVAAIGVGDAAPASRAAGGPNAPASPLASGPSNISARGPVIVAVVVDQLASWVLRERMSLLPDTGGLARLRREGTYVPEMAFEHAITETAPGHASLFTGKTPRQHGIVANDVLGEDGKKLAFIADPGEPSALVSLECGKVRGTGSSLAKLDAEAEPFAAEFRRRYPKGQGFVVALSLKDRGALFGAGELADAAIWFDTKAPGAADPTRERGGFVTSRRYAGANCNRGLASFVTTYLATDQHDRRNGIERIEERAWSALDPAWLARNAGVPIDGDYAGFFASHLASLAPKPGSAYRALPESDRLLLEMAVWMMKDQAGRLPVFLSLSLSANDYIGHIFGPDSWEAWDELYRLDQNLAWFFSQLDALGHPSWSAVLSADHGVVPTQSPSRRKMCTNSLEADLASPRPCSSHSEESVRVFSDDIKRVAEAASSRATLPAAARGSGGTIVAGVVYPYIYLTDTAKAALRREPLARVRLLKKLQAELKRRFKAIHSIVDVQTIREQARCPDPRKDPLAALVCESVSPRADRGGEYYIVLSPGAIYDPDLVKGSGSSHGTPYGYDRIVPLFVRDPARPELAGKVEDGRARFTRFREELSRMLAHGQ